MGSSSSSVDRDRVGRSKIGPLPTEGVVNAGFGFTVIGTDVDFVESLTDVIFTVAVVPAETVTGAAYVAVKAVD